MKAPNAMRIAALAAVAALMLPRCGQAAVYTFNDSGPVPQGGTSLSFEHSITGSPDSISSIGLILTFSSGHHLDGNFIRGALILDPGGTGATTSYEAFNPSVTSSGSGGQQICSLRFSDGGSFKAYNPNTTWALNFWDTAADGIENSLVSWSLDVSEGTPVPEPVNVAVAIVAGAFLLARLLGNASKGRITAPVHLNGSAEQPFI
jgi:hypothetical protein